jgi:hypothetical protein
MNPSFKVSAECFYALAAHMPYQVTAEARFRSACLEDERRIVSALTTALSDGVIDETAPGSGIIAGTPALTPEQAARRLRALGAGTLGETCRSSRCRSLRRSPTS